MQLILGDYIMSSLNDTFGKVESEHNCCFTVLKISHTKNYQVESRTRSLSLRLLSTLPKVMQSSRTTVPLPRQNNSVL